MPMEDRDVAVSKLLAMGAVFTEEVLHRKRLTLGKYKLEAWPGRQVDVTTDMRACARITRKWIGSQWKVAVVDWTRQMDGWHPWVSVTKYGSFEDAVRAALRLVDQDWSGAPAIQNVE